jgi:hypothetical protein
MAKSIKDVGNGFDPDRVGQAVKSIEAIEAEIASMTGEHMAACKVKRGRIALIKKEAKKAWGIPRVELNALLKERSLQRKVDAVRADLDGDQVDTVEMLAVALGKFADTPLGKAAVAKAGKAGKAGNGSKAATAAPA